ILDTRWVDSTQPQPGLLDCIFSLTGRAQHADGDRSEVRAICLELVCEPVAVHQSHSPVAVRQWSDDSKPTNVTGGTTMAWNSAGGKLHAGYPGPVHAADSHDLIGVHG